MFLRSGNARRILFLVDRIELERQAKKNFVEYLQNDFSTSVFKEKRREWKDHRIVVTTIQSIASDNKYLKLFTPTDFDLVISDEAHRSVSGGGRAIFEYFLGYKLGLTATPKDYLRSIDQADLSENDPRELERRILLSTYQTFGCERGTPTFRYVLNDGVKDKHLIPPIAVDCRTEITTELLSEQGYAVPTESDNEDETIFTKTDFEKNFFSKDTNHIFAKTFFDNALKDPITGEIGKTICFCVSRRHAAKMTEILNRIADEAFPGKYKGDFAVQITSNVPGAQDMSVDFSNDKLNGYTRFLEGYESSRTRVALTVGMMTTGYDCPNLLNLCLMRPIFSPTDFMQIKGRGTRKADFIYEGRFEGELRKIKKEKTGYKIFDFFGNIEYFEGDEAYGQVIPLPKPGKPKINDDEPKPPNPDDYISEIPDPLRSLKETYTDEWGLRIDREYGAGFEREAGADKEIRQAWEEGDISTQTQLYEEKYFDKPDMYYTLDKLRNAFGADHRISIEELSDFLFARKAFPKLPDIVDSEYEGFIRTGKLGADLYYEGKDLFHLYLLDEQARASINKKRFTDFSDEPETSQTLAKLGKEKIKLLTDYMKENISFNRFTI